MKCAACGGEGMVEGALADPSGGGDISFKFSDTPLLKRIFGIGTRPVRAYGCTRCGHLQLAVRFTGEDLERRRQFDGPQPGVVERLAEES